MPLSEVKRLTWHQIQEVYFHERDAETGAITLHYDGEEATQDELFRAQCAKMGFSREETELFWGENMELFAVEYALLNRGATYEETQAARKAKESEIRRTRAQKVRW